MSKREILDPIKDYHDAFQVYVRGIVEEAMRDVIRKTITEPLAAAILSGKVKVPGQTVEIVHHAYDNTDIIRMVEKQNSRTREYKKKQTKRRK